MSDQALENAIKARDEMRAEIAEAKKQISEWRSTSDRAERFIADWQEFSGQKVPERKGGIVRRASVPTERPKNPKKEEVAGVVRQILMQKSHPMTRDEIFAELPNCGIHIHGKNPPVVLQTMLWRSQDAIVHLKGLGYWAQSEPWPNADYDPTQPTEAEARSNDELDTEAKTLI